MVVVVPLIVVVVVLDVEGCFVDDVPECEWERRATNVVPTNSTKIINMTKRDGW
jgi:hypothetical protein